MHAEQQWEKVKKRNNQLFLKDYFKDDFTDMDIPYHMFEEEDFLPQMVVQFKDYV